MALRTDRPTPETIATELLIMLGTMFVVGMASVVPLALVARRFVPPMSDEERERAIEKDQAHLQKQLESATRRLVLWHVPTLIAGATVLAAFGAIVLARALVR